MYSRVVFAKDRWHRSHYARHARMRSIFTMNSSPLGARCCCCGARLLSRASVNFRHHQRPKARKLSARGKNKKQRKRARARAGEKLPLVEHVFLIQPCFISLFQNESRCDQRPRCAASPRFCSACLDAVPPVSHFIF